MNFFYGIEVERQAPVKPVHSLRDANYKAALWRSVQKRRDAFEARFAPVIRMTLNSYFKEIADNIRPDNMRGDSFQLDKTKIENTMVALYKTVGIAFAREMYSRLSTSKDINQSDWDTFMENYVKTEAGAKIISMTGETKRQALGIIREVLEQAVNEGWGADVTARKIQTALLTKGTELTRWRASMIARTEIMTASNLGHRIGAESTGLPMLKYWISTYDSRTRDTHRVVEQQNPKMLNEPFIVGITPMLMPGDSNGPAEEVINCRCVLTYEVI